MLLVREIMFCKPGKVRPLVDKFLAMTVLGVSILGVGWQWPIVGTAIRVIGPR